VRPCRVTPLEGGSACSYPSAVRGCPTVALQSGRAASRLSAVFRAQLPASRSYWPSTRLVRVSDGLTTSARCHASLQGPASELRIVALGRARSWIRRVASCRSKCNRWVKGSTASPSRTPACLDTGPCASGPATGFSFARSLAPILSPRLRPLSTRPAGSAAA
jgi:hypothetical protein